MLLACFVALALLHFAASLVLYLRVRKDKAEKSVRTLLFLSVTTLAWNIVNILLLNDKFVVAHLTFSVFINKLGFALGVLIAFFSYLLTRHFPQERTGQAKTYKIAVILTAVFVLACFRAEISGLMAIGGDGVSTYVYGSLIIPYILCILYLGINAVRNLIRSIKGENSPALKKQSLTVLGGLFAMIAMAIVFIIAVPSLGVAGDWPYIIGYFSSYIFTGAVLYSMLRQQLFDIRGVLARAAAYILLMGVVLGAYFGIVLLLTDIVYSLVEVSSLTRSLINAVVTVLLLVGFAPMKKYFDRLTERLFFRNYFDPEELIGRLADVTTHEIELDVLIQKSLAAFQEYLQPTHLSLVISQKSFSLGATQSTKELPVEEKVEHLLLSINGFKNDIITINNKELLSDQNIKQHFDELKIECLLRLATKQKSVGYLIFSEKKNGDPYSKKETKALTVCGQQLSVAMENAERFEKIKNFNEELQAKITEATKELRETNEKLKELDEAKDEFISMASHQLRTPLTSVKGYLSMVLEGDVGKVAKQQSELLTQAFTSAQRMVYLISDLLNVSRLKTGKFLIEPTPTYLPDVIEEELKQVEETAKSRGVKIVFDKPKAFPTLELDDTKIRQVIMNFVDNAIYYTPSGGEINVGLSTDEKQAEFKVKDNGIGVPKAEKAHLFAKFYRAGNARKARPDGTGLGLFMAKKVIDSSGGEIIFDSEEGKGSTFGFSFPLKTTHQADTKPAKPSSPQP